MKFNMLLNYIDEVIVLDPNTLEDMIGKLEYFRSYFVNIFYCGNIEILKLINSITELYFFKNQDNFKNIYIELRELVMNWAKYEKSISE